MTLKGQRRDPYMFWCPLSRKWLEIQTWQQWRLEIDAQLRWTTNRKCHIAHRMVTLSTTSRDPEKVKVVTPISLVPIVSKIDFWRMSTSRDTRSLTLKHSDSRLNFVAICSRTREMPGGKVPPPTCRCDILF